MMENLDIKNKISQDLLIIPIIRRMDHEHNRIECCDANKKWKNYGFLRRKMDYLKIIKEMM